MEEYLLPQENITIQDQRNKYAIRCCTNSLGANRRITEYCETKCGNISNNAHIFSFPVINIGQEKYEYEAILNGCTLEKKKTP